MLTEKLFISFERVKALRCGSFSEKKFKKKHLRHPDKNFCYICKPNIPVINYHRFQKCDQIFKKYEFVKNQINGESRFHQIPTISQRFLLFLNRAEFWESVFETLEATGSLIVNPIQDGLFRGCSLMGGWLFVTPYLKSASHILQW